MAFRVGCFDTRVRRFKRLQPSASCSRFSKKRREKPRARRDQWKHTGNFARVGEVISLFGVSRDDVRHRGRAPLSAVRYCYKKRAFGPGGIQAAGPEQISDWPKNKGTLQLLHTDAHGSDSHEYIARAAHSLPSYEY